MRKLTDVQFSRQVSRYAKQMLREFQPNILCADMLPEAYGDAAQVQLDKAALALARALIKAAIRAA